jgi:hypothetical protein
MIFWGWVVARLGFAVELIVHDMNIWMSMLITHAYCGTCRPDKLASLRLVMLVVTA